MRRRLLNLLTLLSLFLFVLLLAASIRSHLVWREYVRWGEASGLTWHRVILRLGRGQIGIAFDRVAHAPPVPADLVSEIQDKHRNFQTSGVNYGQVDPRSEMTRHLNSFWRRRGFYFVFGRDHRPAYLYRQTDSTWHRQPKVETRLIADTPYWPLLLLTAAAPALRLVRYERRRRNFRSGCCRRCGYDLRATPDRCPECGRAKE